MNLVLFIIAIFATTIGGITGIGGGVIIKPLLDLMDVFDVSTIAVLSSFTVLSMAIISIYKQLIQKTFTIDSKLVIIALASILGGVLGQNLLDLSIVYIENLSLIKIIQNTIMVVLLLLVYIYRNKTMDINNKYNNTGYFMMGIILGIISSFLGIGGGPINVATFTILFGLSAKQAAFNSIITILFSNTAKLFTVFIDTGFSVYDLSALPFMIIGAILGGVIGSNLSKKINNDKVKNIFAYMTLVIICINVYSIFQTIYSTN
ncbi:sulfite exporter TauE/SafE family protein [Clostridioides difficile]